MKIKKTLAFLLALCMLAALLTACASEEPAPPDSSDPGSSFDPTPDDQDGDDGDEITTIKFFWTDSGNTGSGQKVELVEEAINAITEREIGVHVEMNWIASADYATQLTLAVTNNEQADVAVFQFFGKTSFSTYYANGLMRDVTDLLDEYAPDLKSLLGDDLLLSTSVDGRVYGIPTYRILNSDYYYCARTDLLEQAGVLDLAKNMTTWSEYESVMEAISQLGDVYGHAAVLGNPMGDPGAIFGADSFADCYAYDALGDAYFLIYTDNDGHVSNLWENEEFLNQCKMIQRWNDNGWLWPDAAFTQDSAETLISQGVAAGYVVQSEYGVEVNKTQNFGADATCVKVCDSFITSYNAKKIGAFIPKSASEPEAAMKFLNLLYTNADLMNLFIWGVEDETYVVNDGQACYPEGTDASTCGYHANDFTLGNQFLCLPWNGSGADFRTRALENFQNAAISPYMGLTVDTSDYQTLVSAVSSVSEEYRKQLQCGLWDAALYSEYMEKLDAAGIDEYIALYADAVSAWNA